MAERPKAISQCGLAPRIDSAQFTMRKLAPSSFYRVACATCILFLTMGAAHCAVDVVYNFADYSNHPLNVRRVTITPLGAAADYGGAELSQKPIIYNAATYPTLTNGYVTVTNLITGYAYRVAFSDGYGEPTITNYFGTNLSGTVSGYTNRTTYVSWNAGRIVGVWLQHGGTASATNIILRAGSNVTITTNSPSDWTIESTGGGSTNTSAVTASQLAVPTTNGAGVVTITVATNTIKAVSLQDGSVTNNDSRALSFASSLDVGGANTVSINSAADGVVRAVSYVASGNYIGSAIMLTNGSPNLATNAATATDGQALVKRGDRLKLETISGSGTQTNISYLDVTNLATGVPLIMATNNAATATRSTNAADGSKLGWNLRLNKGNRSPVYYIGDYDFDSDVGDEHGVKIACTMFDNQLLIPLAFGNTLTNEYAAAALQSFLTYYGYGDVPVGVTRTQRYSLTAFGHAPNMTNVALRATYPAYSLYNSNFPTAVDVYRKALVGAPDGSVVMNFEGDLNNLYQLWNSTADTFSPLTGQQLLEQKIKYLLIDAGTTNNVSGYNLAVDPLAASVITNLTVPVVFCLVSMPTNYVGQNTANPLYHPEDSPVYQGATNYMGIYGLSSPQRYGWDGYSKIYIAAAANITDGTNWLDGTALTKISGPYRMVYSGANDYLYLSNSLPGVTANQYYLTEGGLNNIATNFINAFIDAPAARGQGDYRNFARLAASTNTYSGKANFNNNSTNAVSIGTNTFVADNVNGRVQIGADRATFYSGMTTNRLEINGSPATSTVGSFEWMQTWQKPVNTSPSVWPQAMRFGLSRSKSVTSFSADTLLRWQIYDNASTILNDDSTWTSYLDVTKTNFAPLIPVTMSSFLAMKTNYVGADWTPVIGVTKFCASNNAVYSVSTTKTNLIVAP